MLENNVRLACQKSMMAQKAQLLNPAKLMPIQMIAVTVGSIIRLCFQIIYQPVGLGDACNARLDGK